MYLIDTNIYLEILLNQAKKEACKKFLDLNTGNIYISDFSLHSIGVILFRNEKENIFIKFVNDIIPKVKIITLSDESYRDLPDIKNNCEHSVKSILNLSYKLVYPRHQG